MERSIGLTRRALVAAAAAGGLAPRLLTVANAQGVAPKRGGTLNMLLTPEPPILVLGVNSQAPTLIAGSKIYQGLIKFSPTLEPLPELAKSWEISEDKRTYTFHLQEGVTWHDGQPFTADDVVFSIMKFNMELAPRARGIFAKIKQTTTPDPHTVTMTLDTPFEPFLLMFDVTAAVIVAKHVFDGTDYRNNPANQHPIGTGPFAFAEWQRGSFIRLKRYEKYWKKDQPYLDEIIFRIVPDSQSRAIALETGQVQMSESGDIEPFDVPRFEQQPNLNYTTKGWEYFAPLMWLELNHRIKPLDDVRVRQALSHAIDRDFVLKRLWFGVGKPATGPISSSTKYYDGADKLPGYDPKAAAALLDAAGLKPNDSGVRFTLKHLVLPYGEVWSRLSEYLRTAFKNVGVELVLESTDPGGWSRKVSEWDYDTTINYLYQYGDPTLGVARTYVSTNIQHVTFTNTGGYKNPKVDDLFAQAQAAVAATERQAAFTAVTKILVEDVPQIWIQEMAFPTFTDKRLHDVIELGTGVHASFDDVFLA